MLVMEAGNASRVWVDFNDTRDDDTVWVSKNNFLILYGNDPWGLGKLIVVDDGYGQTAKGVVADLFGPHGVLVQIDPSTWDWPERRNRTFSFHAEQ